ncbi:MAG: hypothetical protein M9939_26520 [Mesorhizobium sp.]|nr:hypothetical protein [Mesorhizobium sp.]MCO5164648.1 hypothetical protein [Mesorhizobium sp.]
MLSLLDTVKLGGAALGGFLVGAGIFYAIGHWRGETAGYDRRIAEVAIADGKAELERKGDDAKLQSMSDYDLCVVGLRGSGMPVDACEQLRGLQQE